MKKIVTLLLFSLSFISFSQQWVQPGAQWSYQDAEGYVFFCWWKIPFKYRYEGNQQIGGQLCQKFTRINYTINNSTLDSTVTTIGYTYTSGDTVYYWHHNQFFVLLDFSAQIGDSWIISDSLKNSNNIFFDNICGDTSTVTVIDIGTVNLDGNIYRTITLETNSLSPYSMTGTYYERFGRLYNLTYYSQHGFIFPVINHDNCEQNVSIDWCAIEFDCYQDDNFSLNPSGGCGFVLSVEENNIPNQFEIYPNPAQSEINIIIDSYNNKTSFTITNTLGAIVKTGIINANQTSINLNDLPTGTYFIQVFSPNQSYQISNFVKV